MSFPTHSYPAAIEDHYDLLLAVNNYSSKVVGIVSAGQTGIPVVSAGNLPASGQVSIDNEIIFYTYIDTSGANPVLSNCIRGFDNTVATQHGDGSAIEMRWVALNHNQLANSILAIEGELGVYPKDTYTSVAARLAANLPLIIPMALSAVWNFTHTRKRIVGVQLYRLNLGTGNYELFEAPIEQIPSGVGVSQVNIPLNTAEQGYVVCL